MCVCGYVNNTIAIIFHIFDLVLRDLSICFRKTYFKMNSCQKSTKKVNIFICFIVRDKKKIEFRIYNFKFKMRTCFLLRNSLQKNSALYSGLGVILRPLNFSLSRRPKLAPVGLTSKESPQSII